MDNFLDLFIALKRGTHKRTRSQYKNCISVGTFYHNAVKIKISNIVVYKKINVKKVKHSMFNLKTTPNFITALHVILEISVTIN